MFKYNTDRCTLRRGLTMEEGWLTGMASGLLLIFRLARGLSRRRMQSSNEWIKVSQVSLSSEAHSVILCKHNISYFFLKWPHTQLSGSFTTLMPIASILFCTGVSTRGLDQFNLTDLLTLRPVLNQHNYSTFQLALFLYSGWFFLVIIWLHHNREPDRWDICSFSPVTACHGAQWAGQYHCSTS